MRVSHGSRLKLLMSDAVKYVRWTLAQRASLAQTCAASMFHMFLDTKYRGENWQFSHMPNLISKHVKIQCLMSCVNKKHHESTCKLAVDFYNEYLAEAMEKLST